MNIRPLLLGLPLLLTGCSTMSNFSWSSLSPLNWFGSSLEVSAKGVGDLNAGTPMSESAINDGLILENQIFTLLRANFEREEYYTRLVSFVFDLLYVTERGQLLDVRTPFDDFSAERWAEIVRTKTGIYTFYAPLHVALELAGVRAQPAYERALSFALAVGEYFQAQDDFLDCYGDAAKMGKEGTDIENGKCSWLVVEALRRASAVQRATLQENYGVDEPARIAAVKRVYDELELRDAFRAFEASVSTRLHEEAARLDGRLAIVGQQLLQRLFKRAA